MVGIDGTEMEWGCWVDGVGVDITYDSAIIVSVGMWGREIREV